MDIEIVKRGTKFYLQDAETGEPVGDPKGYPSQMAAERARGTMEEAQKLPKSPGMPRPTASPVQKMPSMPPPMAGGAGMGGEMMGKLAEMMKKRGG